MEYSATAYIPLGRRSTCTFNYFRSDANVSRTGETDRSVIAREEGLDCVSLADPVQQAECRHVIDNIVDENTYGTVYGTELRWTLTEEARPFNIFIARDMRTLLQVAMFYEMGSVVNKRDELGHVFRASYGAGFRMVTASGMLIRADVATGSEGMETTIIFGYPWETF